jgi:hypothetical protein
MSNIIAFSYKNVAETFTPAALSDLFGKINRRLKTKNTFVILTSQPVAQAARQFAKVKKLQAVIAANPDRDDINEVYRGVNGPDHGGVFAEQNRESHVVVVEDSIGIAPDKRSYLLGKLMGTGMREYMEMDGEKCCAIFDPQKGMEQLVEEIAQAVEFQKLPTR